MARLHDARIGLLVSFKEINVISNDPIQAVQPGLSELQACLLGLVRTLQEGGDGDLPAEPAAIEEAHAWLQSAASFAAACSASAYEALLKADGLGPGSTWQAVAEGAAAGLQAAENAYLAEMARQKRAKLTEDVEKGVVSRSFAATGYTRPSAKPYATYWAKKIAI